MAHVTRERYSEIVLAKLRKELVLKDDVVFNNDYEGDPKAGAVKIPVRDTEVAVGDYNTASGIQLGTGSTSYVTMSINKDKAINEIIDGYEAEAVPADLVADRLDSGGYSLALQMDTDGAAELISGGTAYNSTTLTKDNIYSVRFAPYFRLRRTLRTRAKRLYRPVPHRVVPSLLPQGQ